MDLASPGVVPESDNGESIAFWHDNWNGEPLFIRSAGRSRPPQNLISLKQALPRLDQLAPHLSTADIATLTAQEDVMIWRSDKSDIYSSKYAYEAMIGGGKVLTRYVLLRTKIACDQSCVTFSSGHSETIFHLLFKCRYAEVVWENAVAILGQTIMVPATSVQEIWKKSWIKVKQRSAMSYKKWGVRFVAVCWLIWKERNARIFNTNRSRAEGLGFTAVQIANL
ncbi:uncharacterized protein LOC144573752 [Carex rostrata]